VPPQPAREIRAVAAGNGPRRKVSPFCEVDKRRWRQDCRKERRIAWKCGCSCSTRSSLGRGRQRCGSVLEASKASVWDPLLSRVSGLLAPLAKVSCVVLRVALDLLLGACAIAVPPAACCTRRATRRVSATPSDGACGRVRGLGVVLRGLLGLVCLGFVLLGATDRARPQTVVSGSTRVERTFTVPPGMSSQHVFGIGGHGGAGGRSFAPGGFGAVATADLTVSAGEVVGQRRVGARAPASKRLMGSMAAGRAAPVVGGSGSPRWERCTCMDRMSSTLSPTVGQTAPTRAASAPPRDRIRPPAAERPATAAARRAAPAR
jgi:hypothetical protein